MTKNSASAAPTGSPLGHPPENATITIVCNGVARALCAGTTVAALLDELALPTRQVAVEINLDLVPRARHGQQVLAEGDRVEIVSLVGGG